MRASILIAATIIGLAGAAATPAMAQAYDPRFPICLKRFGPVTYIDCRYNSLDQCRFTASGIGATCLVNPFFAASEPRGRRERRRAY